MFYMNGSIITDIFFTLAGLLLAHSLLRTLDKKKRFNFINNVLSRYLRLTPPYAVILFFFVWIFPLLDSGPFWKREVEEEAAKCAANWWANLLYIHNYVKPLELCMYHTWHLSVDFQLFILSHFVIYMFWRMPRKIGYLFLGTLTIVGSIIPFIATYLYNVSPIFRITPVIHNVQEVSYFKTYYIKTHFRFSAYFIGIITGAILHDVNKQIKWQVPKFWSHVLILPFPVTVYIAFQLWSYKFFIPYGDTSILEDALYAFFYRLLPSLCLSFTIILLSVGSHIECYTSVIEIISRWVQVLSRLTYGVFLVSEIIHIFHTGRVRTARQFSYYDLTWEIVPDAIYAFAISLVLTVCVEEPFRKLAKQIFPN
ncbi:nose resistant to fluoxetine protein 6-like [Linepithema humile]|uniref:nose resistant to fluoxetine protein 6-like n=1 Tax=Linepithema humile TaxID=83485 RepID=UPI00351E6F51